MSTYKYLLRFSTEWLWLFTIHHFLSKVFLDLVDASCSFSMLLRESLSPALLSHFDKVSSFASLAHYFHDTGVVFEVAFISGATCRIIVVWEFQRIAVHAAREQRQIVLIVSNHSLEVRLACPGSFEPILEGLPATSNSGVEATLKLFLGVLGCLRPKIIEGQFGKFATLDHLT